MADPLLDDVPVDDIHGDQRGRIIGSCVAIFVITDLFVLLRLVSRKLARAGYWVRILHASMQSCMKAIVVWCADGVFLVGRCSRCYCDGELDCATVHGIWLNGYSVICECSLHHLVHWYVLQSCETSTAADPWLPCAELPNGYGRHIYIWPVNERLEKETRWRRDFFVFELFFHTAITICKLSV